MVAFEKEKLRDKDYRQKFYAKLEEINSIRRQHTYIAYATNRKLFEELRVLYEHNLKDYEAYFARNYKKYETIKSRAKEAHHHIHKQRFPHLQSMYQEIDAILAIQSYEENAKATDLIEKLGKKVEAYIEECKNWEAALADMRKLLAKLRNEVWAEDYSLFSAQYDAHKTKIHGKHLPTTAIILDKKQLEQARKKKRDQIAHLRSKAGNSTHLIEKIDELEHGYKSYTDYEEVEKAVAKQIKVRTIKLGISGMVVLAVLLTLAIIGPGIYANYLEEESWKFAQDTNSYISYSRYLNTYPYGQFAPMAQKARLALTHGVIPKIESQEGSYRYQGALLAGEPHGKGTAIFANGNLFEGEWKAGIRSGRGTLTESNGASYEGEWLQGLRHGKGRQKWQSGDVYDGEWVEGVREGQGTLLRTDSSKYTGGWVKGKLEGQGTFVYADGSKYIGKWKAGFRHGQGTYYFSDGSKYNGAWREDMREGFGSMRWRDGRTYSGGWLANQRSGRGRIKWPNGSSYEGQWVNDQINGLGTFNSRLREPFTGRWETTAQGGRIVYDNSGLVLRKGRFKDGLFMPD